MHLILLERYVGDYGPLNYAVTFEGTLAECRAEGHHDGATAPLLKANFGEGPSESKSLIGPEGHHDPGRIVELLPVGGG